MAPVTIMKMTAKIEFEDGEPRVLETEKFEWYDPTGVGEIRLDTGPVIVSPGRTLRLTTSFMVPADDPVDGVDELGALCHLPSSAKLSELKAIDSLNHVYLLDELVNFTVQRVPVILPSP